MALNDFETERVEKTVATYVQKHRPPVDVRELVDLSFRVSGQSVELFEVRPRWDNREEKVEEPIAKARYVKSRQRWSVYWMRADSKWHKYPPRPEVRTLEAFLKLVEEDKHGCFYG
jgi:hypothetical protein